MKYASATVVLLALLSACVQTPPPAPAAPAPAPTPVAAAPAPAPVDHYVRIQGATCDTFLGLSADDRQAATMFYIGYMAKRFGTAAINVGRIPSIGGLATDYCSAEPRRRVADAFAEAYRDTRNW